MASTILPVKTHPVVGYRIDELPGADAVIAAFQTCGRRASNRGLRLTFHPDQFVVLSTPRDDVLCRSIEDLEYHADVADWIGADVINIHVGGAQGGKPAAMERFSRQVERLSAGVRRRLTIENDDVVYTPCDLLPLCRATAVPLTYDVHHHRCLADSLTIDEATAAAAETWDREPVVHISSPRDGWQGSQPRRHHDFIDVGDFPECWRGLPITVEIEAKAKERAVLRLRDELRGGKHRSRAV